MEAWRTGFDESVPVHRVRTGTWTRRQIFGVWKSDAALVRMIPFCRRVPPYLFHAIHDQAVCRWSMYTTGDVKAMTASTIHKKSWNAIVASQKLSIDCSPDLTCTGPSFPVASLLRALLWPHCKERSSCLASESQWHRSRDRMPAYLPTEYADRIASYHRADTYRWSDFTWPAWLRGMPCAYTQRSLRTNMTTAQASPPQQRTSE